MGSKNNNAQNKADKAKTQHQQTVDAIQASEAKEVRPTAAGIESKFKSDYKKGAGSKYTGKLADAMANKAFDSSPLGKMKKAGVSFDALGRSGLPGEYNVTPGGMQDTVQGTFGYKEYSDLAKMVDEGKVAGYGGFDPLKPTSFQGFSNLNEQAAANQLFGFSPTQNMGIINSLRYGATNPQAIRGYQQLGNLVKGIGTLSPIQNVFRGMLGIDPVKMTEINPFNIGPGFAQYPDQFTRSFTNPELEAMTNPAIYDRLFNDVAPVQTGMFNPMQPGEDMINVMPMKNPFGNPFSPAIVSDEQKKAFNAEFANNALGAYYNQFPPEQLIGAGIDPNNPILQTTTNRLTPGQIMGLEAQGMGAHVGGIGPYNTDSPFVQSALQGTNTSSGYDLTSGSSAQKTFDSLYNMQNYGITGGL